MSVVTISNSNPNIIYAGNGNSFYRSIDGGISWKNPADESDRPWALRNLGGVPISAVVDPENSEVIFVNSYQGGNYKSTDGAKSWISASRGYSGADLRDITVDPCIQRKSIQWVEVALFQVLTEEMIGKV